MSSHEGNKAAIPTERIEELRRILTREQKRPITYDEAFHVAKLLLNFYDNLADNTIGAGKVSFTEVPA